MESIKTKTNKKDVNKLNQFGLIDLFMFIQLRVLCLETYHIVLMIE